LSFTGGGEEQGRRQWRIGVLERVYLQEVGKGASRSSSTTLNSHPEREREREARGGGGIMWRPTLAIDGRGHLGQGLRKGKRPN
jgi:hypothetical protein